MQNRRSVLWLLSLLLAASALSARAEAPIVFLVRHAERADAGAAPQKDPDLSAKGRERAEALARELRDAGIRAIYTTEYKRTQETAAPLASSLGVKTTNVPAKESAQLAARLKSSSGNALVVGHSNTLPEIMRMLGVSAPLCIGEGDYDDLFLIVRTAPPQVLHLHYR